MQLPDASQVRAILLDIEGTTTPIDFVSNILFAYASRELETFLRRNFHDPETRSWLLALKDFRRSDFQAGLAVPAWQDDSQEAEIASLTAYGHWLMARDSKLPPLKSLQGKIWLDGYTNGELRGEVYPDVPPSLKRWRQQEKRIYIYSSGSVLAQKLLFGSTAYGDLTSSLDGFFDTKVGTKTDPSSYREIASQVHCTPNQVLFISDAPRELEAAHLTGMHVVLSVRPPHELPSTKFKVVPSLEEIFPN